MVTVSICCIYKVKERKQGTATGPRGLKCLTFYKEKKKPKHELERNSHFLYPHQDYIALFIPMNQEFYAVLQDLHNRIYAVGELGQL